jgi:hypothetical protein
MTYGWSISPVSIDLRLAADWRLTLDLAIWMTPV